MNNFRRWLKNRLAYVESLQHPRNPQDLDDLRDILHDAEQKAAALGLPEVVRACQIRSGPIGVRLAREVLAECLGALPDEPTPLTPSQVAKQLRTSKDTVLGWIKSGQLKAANLASRGKPRYVVTAEAIAEFLRLRQPQPPQPQKQIRSSFKRYST